MPKSSALGKLWSRRMLTSLHASMPLRRILDIGAGIGTYAAFREPGQHWTAVEVWAPYIDAYQLANKYDDLVQQDARSLDWPSLAPLDLVICGDVLEHMTKDEALRLLNGALDRSRMVLVSIPIVHAPQHEVQGNPFERHIKDDWSHAECMASLPDIAAFHTEAEIGVYILSRSATDRSVIRDAAAVIRMNETDEHAGTLKYYEDALAKAPHNIPLLTEYCFKCMPYAPDDVVATLEQICARDDQTVVDRIYQLGFLVFFKEARARQNARLPPRNARDAGDLHFQFTQPEVLRWQAVCRRLVEAKPTSYGGLLMLAQSFLAAGLPQAAEPYFARLRATGRVEVKTAVQFGTEFHRDLDVRATGAIATVLPPPTKVALGVDNLSDIVYVACDYRYFQAYGRALAASFANHAAETVGFALHLFDATEEETAAVAQSLGDMLGALFSLNTEWTGLRTAETSKAARGYYHAVRFLRFLQFVEQSEARMTWMIDADSIFNRPVDALFKLLQGHDAALWFLPGRIEPHNQVCACLVGIASTPNGKNYLRRVAGYIAKYLERGALTWGIDQAALYSVYAYLSGIGSAPATVGVPPDIFDGQRSPGAVLWPAKAA